MKRWTRPLILVLCVVGIILFAGSMLISDNTRPAGSPVQISVITYGNANNTRWGSLELGVRQACSDLGLDVPRLTVASASDPPYQRTLMIREVQNGSRGLIIAANDSTLMTDYLKELPSSVYTVMLEGSANDETPWVGANNWDIGCEIAAYAANATDGVIAVLEESLHRNAAAIRYEAFLAYMESIDREVVVMKRGDQLEDLKSTISSGLAIHKPTIDLLVVLDNDSLEVAIDALPAAMVDIRLCGVGSSEKVVHALDEGSIEYLIYQNEYAMGYLAVMTIARDMGLTKRELPEVGYIAVIREDMYLPEMERVLFPIS